MSGGRGRPDVWRFARERDAAWERERLLIVVLDAKQQIIGVADVPLESLTAAGVRKVFKDIPLAEAAALVGVHHQPSTHPRPSKADEALMRRLKRVADQLGVRLLGYAVFWRGRYHIGG